MTSINLPKYPQTAKQERLGVIAVAQALTQAGLIWRETPMADVGIDGQIEYVTAEGLVTGKLIAAQVKSGPSFLEEKDGDCVYYPQEKHRFYWERFPLPVLIILHDPDAGKSYWVDARRALRVASADGNPGIRVPKSNVLQETRPNDLFEGFAILDQEFFDVDKVLNHMINSRSGNASFPISYFDLFCNGLTNICRSLYFSMDVAMQAAEIKLHSTNAPTGVGVGYAEQSFLFSYIKFLVHQHVVDIDFSDCLIDWHDRGLQPTFYGSLTSRGRRLVRMIGELQDHFEKEGRISKQANYRAAQEGLVSMDFEPAHVARVGIIDELQEAYKCTNLVIT